MTARKLPPFAELADELLGILRAMAHDAIDGKPSEPLARRVAARAWLEHAAEVLYLEALGAIERRLPISEPHTHCATCGHELAGWNVPGQPGPVQTSEKPQRPNGQNGHVIDFRRPES